MTPRAFDLAAYKARWRAACAAWDVDPIEGATGYQVVHIKVAQLQAERAKADRGRPVHVTASELRTLITHAPVFDEAPTPTHQQQRVALVDGALFTELYREVHAEIRAERLRAVRGQFVAALVPALVEVLEAEARAERLARMKRRGMPLKLRHRARGFELRWLPDGFGGLRVVEAVVEMAGD